MSKKVLLVTLAPFASIPSSVGATEGIPTAIFHGMRDSCENNQVLVETIKEGTHAFAECIEIGNGKSTSVWTKISLQAEEACEKIKKHPEFQTDEINVIGFSQGGLIGRYIAQHCEIKGKVRNMVTVGTPNMGTTAPPLCGNAMQTEFGDMSFKSILQDVACSVGSVLANEFAYTDFVQDDTSPSGYWRDVDNLETYVKKSSFLSKLNNEMDHDEADKFRDRIKKLNAFVAIQWDRDSVVYPRESQQFAQLSSFDGQFFDGKQDHHYRPVVQNNETHHEGWLPDSEHLELLEQRRIPFETKPQFRGPRELKKMEHTPWYENDNLGMKTLNEQGRFIRLHMQGDHDGWAMSEATEYFVPSLNL